VIIPLAVAAYAQDRVLFLVFGALAIVVVHSIISYRFFSYSISNDRIQAKQGWIKRIHLDLVFERIQNIDIMVPFYYRPLDLVSLKIDSAGSANSEVVLAALKTEDAIAIRESVLGRAGGIDPASSGFDSASGPISGAEEGQLICTRSIADLVRHGMSSNKALIVLAGLAAFAGQAIEVFIDSLENVGFDPAILPGPVWVQITIVVVGLLLTLVASFLLISILGAVLIYFDYQLYATKDGFKARHGLLTRNERTVKTRRIQTVVWRQNWIDRVLGRFNLVFEQISHLPQASQVANDSRLVVPSVLPREAQSLGFRALASADNKNFDPRELDFVGINWRHWRKNSVIALVLIAVAVASIGSPADSIKPLIPGALVVWCLAVALLYRRWRSWGVAQHDDMLVVRAGLFGLNYTLFDRNKLQQIHRISTLFTRRAGLSHLRLNIASQTLTVPYLEDSVVTEITNESLYSLESKQVSWM